MRPRGPKCKKSSQKVRGSVRFKLAFCTTCAVCVLVLAQGPSFVRLERALLRQRGVYKTKGSNDHLERSGMT